MLYDTKRMSREEVASDLLRTREILAKRWAKATWGSDNGSVCLMSAVGLAVGIGSGPLDGKLNVRGPDSAEMRRVGRIVFTLHRTIFGEVCEDLTLDRAISLLVSFNDHERTDRDVVLLALDNAIEELLAPVTDGA